MVRNHDYQLFLKINVVKAGDLALSVAEGHPKSVNPVLVASLNGNKKSTSKKTHTVHPSWDDQLLLPLNIQDYSQILTLSVWDKHKRYKNYLGEVRLCVSDIFHAENKFRSKTELKWYKLYSNDVEHSFVTGSVLVSFELVVKVPTRMSRWRRRNGSQEVPVSTPEVPHIKIDADSDVSSKVESLNISDCESVVSGEISKSSVLNDWIQSLLTPDDILTIKPNDQGFYHTNDLFDVTDSELDTKKKKSPNLNRLSVENDASSLSDASMSETGYSDIGQPETKSKKANKKLLKDKNFEFSLRKVHGVLFMEIVSCTDLPPLRNATRTSYDMDPFVVVAFGKKTFRTSWKRHTLNPIFNERLAFEVLPFENWFDLQFSVFDKDTFTFHDKVGSISVPLKDITDMASITTDDDSTFAVNDGYASNYESDQPTQPSVKILDDDNLVQNIKKTRFTKRKKIVSEYADTSKFKTLTLALDLDNEKFKGKYKPELKIRVRFETYAILRRKFWKILLDQYQIENEDGYDSIELMSMLDTLGCTYSDELVKSFYEEKNKSIWGGDLLSKSEIINCLENHIDSKPKDSQEKLFVFEKCPLCFRQRLSQKDDIDIITHVAICASKDWSIVNKILISSYVSPQIASRKWFSKMFMKVTYGKYKLGSHSANILVQDRTTGVIMEEKMSIYVRLGIRLLYNGLDKAKTKRVRKLLKQLSIKQGVKFDNPLSKNDISSFVKFHGLDMSDCVETDYNRYTTFNEFFYRKLRHGARPIEGPKEPRIAVSPADCRCATFSTVDDATEFWIKGRNFTIAKLFNGNFDGYENTDLYNGNQCSLGIFRLAPQDYHRFHCPVDGTIGNIKYIDGEYYTVNPMAIRSNLDVYGENVRTIIPIKTENFGTVVMIAVGAMMVGSTVLTVESNQTVQRGDEIGYFKFGGSTILLLFEKSKFTFDSDLLNNSNSSVETLIRVGQSIGHSPDVEELPRDRVDFYKQSKDFRLRLIRNLTGGGKTTAAELAEWESKNIKVTDEDFREIVKATMNEKSDEEGSDFDEEGSISSE